VLTGRGRRLPPSLICTCRTFHADDQCLSTLLTRARPSVPFKTVATCGKGTNIEGKAAAACRSPHAGRFGACFGQTPIDLHSLICTCARSRALASLMLAWLSCLRARTGIMMASGVVQETGLDGPGLNSQELHFKPRDGLQVVSLQ
jgi:hypothetical protein